MILSQICSEFSALIRRLEGWKRSEKNDLCCFQFDLKRNLRGPAIHHCGGAARAGRGQATSWTSANIAHWIGRNPHILMPPGPPAKCVTFRLGYIHRIYLLYLSDISSGVWSKIKTKNGRKYTHKIHSHLRKERHWYHLQYCDSILHCTVNECYI